MVIVFRHEIQVTHHSHRLSQTRIHDSAGEQFGTRASNWSRAFRNWLRSSCSWRELSFALSVLRLLRSAWVEGRRPDSRPLAPPTRIEQMACVFLDGPLLLRSLKSTTRADSRGRVLPAERACCASAYTGSATAPWERKLQISDQTESRVGSWAHHSSDRRERP